MTTFDLVLDVCDTLGRPLYEPSASLLDDTSCLCPTTGRRLWLRRFSLGPKAFSTLAGVLRATHSCFAPVAQIRFQERAILLQMVTEKDWRPLNAGDGCNFSAVNRLRLVTDLHRLSLWLQEQGLSPWRAHWVFGWQQHRLCCLGAESLPWHTRLAPAEGDYPVPTLQGAYRAWFANVLRCWFSSGDQVPFVVSDERQGLLMRVLRAELTDEVLWREFGEQAAAVPPLVKAHVADLPKYQGTLDQRRQAGLDALVQRLVQLRSRCAVRSRLCVFTTAHRWAAVAAIFSACGEAGTAAGPLLWLDSGEVSLATGTLRHRLQARLRVMLVELGERPDDSLPLRCLIAGLAAGLARKALTLTLVVTASGVSEQRAQQRVLQLFHRIFQGGLCVIVLTPWWHHAGVSFLSRLWLDKRVFDRFGDAFDDGFGRQPAASEWYLLPEPVQTLWAALVLMPEGLPSRVAGLLLGKASAATFRFLAERDLLRCEQKCAEMTAAGDVALGEVWIPRMALIQAENAALTSMKEAVRPRLVACCDRAGVTDPWLRYRLFPHRRSARGPQGYLAQAVLASLRSWDWRAAASKVLVLPVPDAETETVWSALVALMRGLPQSGADHLVPGLGGLRRGLQACYDARRQDATQAFERLAGSKKAPAVLRAYALVLAAEQAGTAGKPGRALAYQVRLNRQLSACEAGDHSRLWVDRVVVACWLAHFYSDGTPPAPASRDGESRQPTAFEPGARWRAAVAAFCVGDHLTALDHALWLLNHPDLLGDWTFWFAVTRFAADCYHSLNESAGAADVLKRGLQQALAFGLNETAHALASATGFHLCGDGRFTAAQALFLAFPTPPPDKSDASLGRGDLNRRLLFQAAMETRCVPEKRSPAAVNDALVSYKAQILSVPRLSGVEEKRLWRRVGILLRSPILTAAAAADHAAGFMWLAGWAALVGSPSASRAALPGIAEALARRPRRGGFWRDALADLASQPTSAWRNFKAAWPEGVTRWCGCEEVSRDRRGAADRDEFWQHDPSADRVLWFLALTMPELQLKPCSRREARVRAFQQRGGVPARHDGTAALRMGDESLPASLSTQITALSARLDAFDQPALKTIVRAVNQVLTQLLLATGAAEYGAFYWNPLDRDTAWSVPAWLALKPKTTSWQDSVWAWFSCEQICSVPEQPLSFSREIARFRPESATIESAGFAMTELPYGGPDRLVLWLIQGDAAAPALQRSGAALHAFGEVTAAWWPLLYQLFDAGQAAKSLDCFGMVGRSARLQKVVQTVKQYGPSSLPVFIGGETGTGKELAARAVHLASSRAAQPFFAVNCSQYPENLIESHLFGYRQGSFTDAREDRPGLLEHADGGTLFLDEIADISAKTQSLLLRVLQDGGFTRVGCHQSRQVDVRFVTATNVDLAGLVQNGTFRVDLYYRIMGARLQLPPLRDRVEDIALLLEHFFKKHGDGRGLRWEQAFLAALQRHSWPGNIRELEMYARRLMAAFPQVLCFQVNHLLPFLGLHQVAGAADQLPTLKQWETNNRAHLLRERLAAFGGNRSAAAQSLGISRQHLVHLLKIMGSIPEPAAFAEKK